ncbi:RNA recognition motif domain [Lasallia pustulata]|uniref:RNA recognition motif domain n=1 Tax=Lasallia pustulata TaxID=136370 RepID=A0A1W5CVX8_9LECA|nr:RNA recognition motif domain [Lasallia pustulata]
MAAEVSSTRLYLGNLPREVTKEDIQKHFGTHGTGTITEIKLMTGFGFLEYEDPMDARDVVPAYRTSYITSPRALLHINYWWIDGTMLNGSRLTVQFARGSRQRDTFTAPDRETSWQDLKDFARRSGLDVVFSEVGRDRDGKGFVEFETDTDLKTAVEKLDNTDFKGTNVHCYADTKSHAIDTVHALLYPVVMVAVTELRRMTTMVVVDHPPIVATASVVTIIVAPPLDANTTSPVSPVVTAHLLAVAYGREDPYPAPPHRHAYEDHYANGGYERPRPRSPPPARYGGYDDRPRYW